MYPPHSGNQHYPNTDSSGYPPQQNAGYPPQQNAGYPPQQNAGYPPQQNAGYPPQQNSGYPPQQNSGYPPQQSAGYPPQQNTGYPQNSNFPAQPSPGYPPQTTSGYPPHSNTGFPHQDNSYPPPPQVGFSSPEIGFSHHNSDYASQHNQSYPPTNVGYPPTPQTGPGGFTPPIASTGSYSHNNNSPMHKPASSNQPSSDYHPTGLPPPPPAPPGTRPDFPFKWVYANKGLIPEGAIPLGKESDGALSYAARAYHQKSIQIGRVTPALQGVRVGFAGDFTVLKDYYVLCGDPKLTRWVEHSGTLNLNQVSFKPIECGLDIKGDPLYLAAIDYKNGRFLGKVGTHTPGMLYTRNGKERAVPLTETYLILAYS